LSEIKGAKVFPSANDIKKISVPLQSRFRKLFLPKYSEEVFLNVSEKVLSKLSPSIARYIGIQVWDKEDDIRDVISVSGLLMRKNDGPDDCRNYCYNIQLWKGG